MVKRRYSRRELQGWGGIRHQVERTEISFKHVKISPEIKNKYNKNVSQLVESMLKGLGMANDDNVFAVEEITDDLTQAGLRYITYLVDHANEEADILESD